MPSTPRFLKTFWTANRTLILGLTLPLLLASGIALWFSRPITVREVFLNLATDFITIVITVWYVDWILNRQEQLRWQNAEKYISAEAGKLGHSLITAIIEGVRLGDQVFPEKDPPLHKRKIQDIQAEILSKVRRLDHDQIIAKLKQLNANQWAGLMAGIQTKTADITLLLSQFGTRLSPEKVEVLLTAREAIGAAQSTYELLHKFLGVPISALPKVKDDKAFEYTVIATIRIGIDLGIILQKSLAIVDTFAYVVQPPNFDYGEAVTKSWDRYWQ
jgi:hypothetical protein